MTERRPFCSDLSRENDEPLAATASRIDHWFLIEYRGLWTRDAVPGSGLSDQVKQHLRDQVAAARHGRLLFIRRPDAGAGPISLPLPPRPGPVSESITRTEFEAYEDLRGSISSRAGNPAGHPLFLVCTHGKHDHAARATGGRSTTRSGTSSTRTGPGRSPTSAAIASPETSSACRRASTTGASTGSPPAPILDEHLARRI